MKNLLVAFAFRDVPFNLFDLLLGYVARTRILAAHVITLGR